MNTEPKIECLKDLLSLLLCVPDYQRPYTWSVKSASTLFWDVYGAFKNSTDEYRIGSIILYQNGSQYEIVDGQQRLTSISILLYCLDNDSNCGLLNQKYGVASKKALSENFNTMAQLCENFDTKEKELFTDYLLYLCTVVKIVVMNEQEAFQFFDSQNSRGKELAPHDLLKSYHLREMNEDSVADKTAIINEWEGLNQKDLTSFFENNLYPLVHWYRDQYGLGYSSSKIDIFKGIQTSNRYNFSVYHQSANFYIEQVNQSNVSELLSDRKICQFQLTQPLIAGRRFFLYTLHYYELYKVINEKVYSRYSDLSNSGRGDWLVRNLFVNVLVFFVDRFGMASLTDAVYSHLFSWCYSLRLLLHSVYEESVNKYALGKHKINQGKNFFYLISEMNQPEDLFSIPLVKPNKELFKYLERNTYKEIWNKYSKMGLENG